MQIQLISRKYQRFTCLIWVRNMWYPLYRGNPPWALLASRQSRWKNLKREGERAADIKALFSLFRTFFHSQACRPPPDPSPSQAAWNEGSTNLQFASLLGRGYTYSRYVLYRTQYNNHLKIRKKVLFNCKAVIVEDKSKDISINMKN